MLKVNVKQEEFINQYLRTGNATQAYLKAYGGKKSSAAVDASKLLKKSNVKAEIRKRRKELRLTHDVLIDDYVQLLLKIANADIGDYVKFGQRERSMVDKATGEVVKRQVNYVDLADSEGVDTSVISEVRQGRDGVTIKLLDKLQAWKELSRLLGFGRVDQQSQEVHIYLPERGS